MAAVGGVMALWLGLSVLGVLELVHLLVDVVVVLCGKATGQNGSTSTSVTTVKPFVPPPDTNMNNGGTDKQTA